MPKIVCGIDGCGKSTLTTEHMIAHQREHKGLMPFLCPHEGCGKTFSVMCNLKTHLQVHDPHCQYVCPDPACGGRVFRRIRRFNEHLKHFHHMNKETTFVKPGVVTTSSSFLTLPSVPATKPSSSSSSSSPSPSSSPSSSASSPSPSQSLCPTAIQASSSSSSSSSSPSSNPSPSPSLPSPSLRSSYTSITTATFIITRPVAVNPIETRASPKFMFSTPAGSSSNSIISPSNSTPFMASSFASAFRPFSHTQFDSMPPIPQIKPTPQTLGCAQHHSSKLTPEKLPSIHEMLSGRQNHPIIAADSRGFLEPPLKRSRTEFDRPTLPSFSELFKDSPNLFRNPFLSPQ